MGSLDRFVLGLYGLFFMVMGIVTNLINFNYLSHKEFKEILGSIYLSSDDKILWIFLGVLIFLIGISILNIALGRRDSQKAVIIKTDNGEVRISMNAIEDYIRKTALRIKEIRDIKSKIFMRGKELRINSKIILKTDVDVNNIVIKIQNEIEESVHSMLGIDIKLNINLNVVRMVPSKDYDMRPDSGDSSLDESFHGIQY